MNGTAAAARHNDQTTWLTSSICRRVWPCDVVIALNVIKRVSGSARGRGASAVVVRYSSAVVVVALHCACCHCAVDKALFTIWKTAWEWMNYLTKEFVCGFNQRILKGIKWKRVLCLKGLWHLLGTYSIFICSVSSQRNFETSIENAENA